MLDAIFFTTEALSPLSIGGKVDGTDLIIFENDMGGRCIRVRTAIPGTVVIVIMNSKRRLHGGVLPHGGAVKDNGNRSLRWIPYLRGPIQKFLDDRRRIQGAPPVITDLTRGND